MTIMRTPNKKIYAKRGIFLLLATNRGCIDSITKGSGTEGFRANQEHEVGKHFFQTTKKKTSKTSWMKNKSVPINCLKGFRSPRDVNSRRCKKYLI